jgi:predicted ATP-grasp superfamily ATP-dependent carboligase
MHSIEQYPVIQDYIEGIGVGFFALYDKDRQLKAQFCHQRVREYPITGGPSSCCQSIYDDRLIKLGRILLESLGWMGLAMVEWKYDRIRDKFYLIEINPRYWGSLPLAVYSGVNFPVLHIMSTLGINFQPVLEYQIGTKMRFIDKDIKSILMRLREDTGFIEKMKLIKELFNPKLKILDS